MTANLVAGGGARGRPGSPGPIGMTWKGAWNPIGVYTTRDGVAHKGSGWIANQPPGAEEPGTGIKWDAFALAGESAVVDVTDYGAVPGTDCTAAFTAAQADLPNGGDLYVPACAPNLAYELNDFIQAANVVITGDGHYSTIKKDSAGFYCVHVDSGSADVANNIRGVGLRRVRLLGTCVANGFQEHCNLLDWNGVSDWLLEDVECEGYRGDGIYIGSGDNVGGPTERHNQRGIIKGKVFCDGVNRANRNGFTVIDSDGISGDGVVEVVRTGQPGQPGGICVEPDANNFHVIRNIRFNKPRITECPDVAGIALNLRPQSTMLAPQQDIKIIEPFIDGCKYGFSATGEAIGTGPDAQTKDYIVRVTGGVVQNCSRPFFLNGMKDVVFDKTVFQEIDNAAELGYDLNVKNREVRFIGPKFIRCGKVDGRLFNVRELDGVYFEEPTFEDIGKVDLSSGVIFAFLGANTGTNFFLRSPTYRSPLGRTTNISTKDAAYTLVSTAANGEKILEKKLDAAALAAPDIIPSYAKPTGDLAGIGELLFALGGKIRSNTSYVDVIAAAGLSGVAFYESDGTTFLGAVAADASGVVLYDKNTVPQFKANPDGASALGNLRVETLGKGLQVKEGANATIGEVEINAGAGAELVINTTAVTANSRIFLEEVLDGIASGNNPKLKTVTPGASFRVRNMDTAPGGVNTRLFWMIVQKI